MTLTRGADYAVRALVHLAGLPPATRSSLAELARATDVRPVFLSKVLQRLVKTGLLTSRRGKHGGFELTRPPNAVSLLDVVAAMDGLPPLNVCLGGDSCGRSEWCGMHIVWADAQTRMRDVLAGASLDRLAEMTALRRAMLGMDR